MFFADYVWVGGKPRGRSQVLSPSEEIVYKIVKDPYGKRISLERFCSGHFLNSIYDSNLFDFRVIISKVESSWQKIETEDSSALIRDHDDRTIAHEFYVIEDGLCKECRIHYPKGPLVAIQRMFYKENILVAMVLYDALERPAGIKMYAGDTSQECIFESWNMSDKETQEKLETLLSHS